MTYLPYYDEPSNGRYLVHTGLGVLYTKDQDGIARFRARPQIHEGPFLIDSGPLAAGEYTTANLGACDGVGPFSVQSEAFLSNVNSEQRRFGMDRRSVRALQLLPHRREPYLRTLRATRQLSLAATPFSNFFWVPGCCGPGAWELKARWSNLTLNELDCWHSTTISRPASTGIGAIAYGSCSITSIR